MKFHCERCGSCCKLAWAKVAQGEKLPLKEDGSCGHFVKKKGQYECDIFDDRTNACRSSFVQKKLGLDSKAYVVIANESRIKLRQIVRQKCG